MAWQDRILEAAYNSPKGLRTTFDYENLNRETEKKTTAFEFPDLDGTYVQDLGRTGRRYPFRIFIWGDNYDTEAESFYNSLLEKGYGTLEHPVDGSIKVVPFGAIKRADNLKTEANQAVFEITFYETTGLVYPSEQQDSASLVITSINEFNTDESEEFNEVLDIDSEVEKASFKNAYQSVLTNVKSTFKTITETQQDVEKQFNAIYDSINNGIDILIGDPLTLAFQTLLMIQSPARAAASIQARLDAYGNLAQSIFSGNGAANSNELHTQDLYASGYISGAIVSVINTEFENRSDAHAAADYILNLFGDWVIWRDAEFETLGETDTGAAYQQLQEAVAYAAGFLIEISFTLKQEIVVELDRARTIIDFAAEVYGDVDTMLDFLIATNSLTGDEILELPKGREIVYYV